MTNEAIAHVVPFLAGPASAVLVLLLVGYALYRLAVLHAVPLVRELGVRHLQQIDTLLSQQAGITDAFRNLLIKIEQHLADGAQVGVAQAAQLEILREIRSVQAQIRADVDRLADRD
jgi:hypothetical protein